MDILKDGIYVGYSEAQNNGNCFDTGITAMFPYSSSAVSKGADSDNLIGWQMTPEKLFVLFDFTAITFVEKILLETSAIIKEKATIWGTAMVNVSYCDEISSKYFTCGRLYPDNGGSSIVITLNRNVRLIKLEIKRSPWRAYPMPKVTFYGQASENTGMPLSESEMKKEFLYESVCVDDYGQASFLDWEGKIYNDEQMKNNWIEESKKYDKFACDTRFDKYGGVFGYKKLQATGFFRVEKIDGIWWFITPEGNPYIMKGVDLVCYSEMSYHTPIFMKGTNEIRGVFNELPDRKKYSCAYEVTTKGIPVLNYLKMNLYRKYGEDFDSKWVSVTLKRLSDWGFNAASKWHKHKDIKMPYIHSLQAVGPFKKIKWLIDPYDKNFAVNVENSIKNILPALKDDPYLIGYHYTNESGFDNEIFNTMLSSRQDCAMKKAFIKFIKEKYTLNEINAILHLNANDFDELLNEPLPQNTFPQEVINQFISVTADIYYKVINNSIKKYDPNHLYMGGGITPNWRSSYEWDVGGLEYLDVLSFDHYTRSTNHWIEKYAALDFPIVNIEFSFTASDRGLSPIFESIHCANQKERGQEYQKFMEYNFSLPQFIGSGFFILNDQPITGRCGENGDYGECHNFGLIDVTDEPYWDFIEYVKKTHKNLENIHAKMQIL